MKNLFKYITAVTVSLLLVSCFNENSRNYQFFPNMYESVGYEAYGSYEAFENTQEALLPVEGTIPRGWKPYAYEDSNEGYAKAKAELENPLPYTEDNVNEGKALYTIYCAICHGDKGDGKGTLAEREKILGIPAYNDPGRAITEGSTYHVMYYGINTMGSYAVQTSEKERWQIAHHVMDLKRKLDGESKREFEETEEVAEEEKEVQEEDKEHVEGKDVEKENAEETKSESEKK